MDLRELVGHHRFAGLRCQRHLGTTDDAEEISARFRMRAARGPDEQRRQREKGLHAAYLSECGAHDKPFNSGITSIAPEFVTLGRRPSHSQTHRLGAEADFHGLLREKGLPQYSFGILAEINDVTRE